MAKNKFNFSEHSGSIGQLEEYYRSMSELIDRKHNPALNPEYALDFPFMRPDEISEKAATLRRELVFEGNLAVLSYVESVFRVDAIMRCQAKIKQDSLFKKFKKEIKHQNGKTVYHYIRICETILEGWKVECREHVNLLNSLGQAFEYRNWLAHGKYWTYKESVDKYTFEYVLGLAKAVIKAFDGLLFKQLPVGEKIGRI